MDELTDKTIEQKAEPARAIIPLEPGATTELMTISERLLASGMLPVTLRKPEQVAAIILRGRELGIGPMEALTSLHVIKGKVASSTQLMLALIYRSGKLKDIRMTRGDPVSVTMVRKGMSPHTVTFGSEDAKRARLGHRDVYRKWPEVMYLWRAIAMCARVVFPDVVAAVYTPDELGVEIRSDVINGEIIQGLVSNDSSVNTNQAKAVELAAQGLSLTEIAAELSLPVMVVAGWLEEGQ